MADVTREELEKRRDSLRSQILSPNFIELLEESAKSLYSHTYRLQPAGLRLFAEKIEQLRRLDDEISIVDGMALPKKAGN